MRALGERSLSFEWVLLRLDGLLIVARSSSEHVLRLRCAREFFVPAIAVFFEAFQSYFGFHVSLGVFLS